MFAADWVKQLVLYKSGHFQAYEYIFFIFSTNQNTSKKMLYLSLKKIRLSDLFSNFEKPITSTSKWPRPSFLLCSQPPQFQTGNFSIFVKKTPVRMFRCCCLWSLQKHSSTTFSVFQNLSRLSFPLSTFYFFQFIFW